MGASIRVDVTGLKALISKRTNVSEIYSGV